MTTSALILLLITIATITPSTNAFRILLYPFDHLAHVNAFSIIGEELIKRGHVVDIIVADRSQHLATKRGIYGIVRHYEHSLDHTAFEAATHGGLTAQYDYASRLLRTAQEHVKELFADDAMMSQLKGNGYDLVLIEGTAVGRTKLLLPYKLAVPFVSVSILHQPWEAKIPALPSVEGKQGLFLLDQDSTFMERFMNTVAWLLIELFAEPPSYVTGVYDSLFDELVPERENIGFEKLHHKSEMYLILNDVICTDAHRISAPHYQFIGGLGAKHPDPLPIELQEFMDSAKHGAIVLSFGSGRKRIEAELLEPMLAVFKELQQKVILRHDGDVPKSVPKNVRIQKWLPQNDLLAHPNTKLFITHCGANGQTEAVYHGIPMLMMPGMADQFYNARRAERKGYGLILDPHHFDKDEFKQKLNTLLNNQTYYKTSQKCSKVLHSLPSPQNTAAFWIEHVLHHGSEHLKPYYLDMPWYKFWMVDIIVVLCVIVGLVVYVIKMCCVKLCFRSERSKSKRD